MAPSWGVPKPLAAFIFLALTLVKAGLIVKVFMHLGDEKKSFVWGVLIPLSLFIWFIIAFLWDGNSWKVLRNRYNGKPAEIEKVAPAAKEQGAKD